MKESRTQKVKKNIVYAVISQFIKAFLLFLSRIIFARVLGPEYLGINGLFSNVLTVLSLADLGMTTAMMFSLYKPLADNNFILIQKYMKFFGKIYNIIAIVIFFVGVSLIPFLKYIVNLPSNVNNIYIYYLILLLNSVLSYLFIYKTTLLAADQKMYIINKYDTFIQIFQFALQLLMLLLFHSFILYLSIQVVCTLLGNILKVLSVNKMYPYLNNGINDELSRNEKKDIFNNIKSLFFYKLGGIIQSNTDNVLISIFVGTIVVGYYSNYNLIILQIINFVTIVFTAIKATIGNYNVDSSIEEQYNMFNRLEFFNFILVGFSSIYLLFLVPDFISLCFGKEYVINFLCYIFIILNYYTANIRQTLWIYRETSGIFEKTKYITIITAFFNIIFSIILGKLFGLLGIVSATVISRMIYAWWKEPIIIFRDVFSKSSKEYFKKYIIRLLFILIISCILYITFLFIKIDNIIVLLIIKFLIISVLLFICFIAFFFKKDEFKFFKNKLLGDKHE